MPKGTSRCSLALWQTSQDTFKSLMLHYLQPYVSKHSLTKFMTLASALQGYGNVKQGKYFGKYSRNSQWVQSLPFLTDILSKQSVVQLGCSSLPSYIFRLTRCGIYHFTFFLTSSGGHTNQKRPLEWVLERALETPWEAPWVGPQLRDWVLSKQVTSARKTYPAPPSHLTGWLSGIHRDLVMN